MKPFFIPRDWLKHPSEGGKTPREIIDFIMLKIGKIAGQSELIPNSRLKWRKRLRNKNPNAKWSD